MTSKINDSNETKKKKGLEALLERIVKYFFSLDVVKELIRINKSLRTADELTGGLKSKGAPKNKSPFKVQIKKNLLVVILLVLLPLVWTGLFSFMLIKRPEMFSYFMVVIERLADSLTEGFNPKFVIGYDLIEFHRWKTWGSLFLIVFIIEMYLRKIVIKNHKILNKTRELKERCLVAGFITEKGNRDLLWTPSGVLIDLEKNSDEEFVKSNEVWLQMSMFPGDVKISQENRHLIFVHVGQKLRESYHYFSSGNIEVSDE